MTNAEKELAKLQRSICCNTKLINVTLTRALQLINSNSLSVGRYYQISGVDPTLYDDGTTSGTTIILQAVSTNAFNPEGVGKFYNPKYDTGLHNSGIWTNLAQIDATLTSGPIVFNMGEFIIADNGAEGYLYGGVSGYFIPDSGDWSTAVSITGDDSGATATINSVTLVSYDIGSKIIWGGYSWTNVNGNIGTSTDPLNLDSEWTKNIYSTTDYNLVWDIITYDIAHDQIIKRYEVENDNIVTCGSDSYDVLLDDYDIQRPIAAFQFGSITDNLDGCFSNRVDNSYFENINFTNSASVSNNVIQQISTIYFNIIYDITMTGNIIINSAIVDNNFIASGLENVALNRTTIEDNTLFNGSLSGLEMNNSTISSNKFNASIIFSTNIFGSSIILNDFDNSAIGHSNILSNSEFRTVGKIVNKNFQYLNMIAVEFNLDFSAAVDIFNGKYTKNIIGRPDGTAKLTYINNSDVLVITDVNA